MVALQIFYFFFFKKYEYSLVCFYVQGPAPAPRGCHASALLGNKGYICGGVVSWLDLAEQFICTTVNILFFKPMSTLCTCGHLALLVPIKGNLNTSAYRDVLDNSVLQTLW